MFYVPNTVAFGRTPRVLNHFDSNCGFGEAASGEYFVGMLASANPHFLENAIFGLELDTPMVAGTSYSVTFAVKAFNRSVRRNRLRFGLGNGLFDFGPIVAETEGPQLDEGWQRWEINFVAPVTARYFNVGIRFGNEAFFLVDDFAINCPTEVFLGEDTTVCRINNWLLQPQGFFSAYRWQDGSTDSLFVADGPGTYSLSATRFGCVVRDTITLLEFDQNCDCSFYIPTAFSPNDDGINDAFLPLTPCEVSDYQLQLYDRWGRLIFESDAPARGWTARKKWAYYPAGVYAYTLRYRFSYQEEVQRRSGEVALLR